MHALAHHCGSLPKHHRVDWGLLFYLTNWCGNKQSTLRKKSGLDQSNVYSPGSFKRSNKFPIFMLPFGLHVTDFFGFHLFLQYICITNHGSIEMQFFFVWFWNLKSYKANKQRFFWGLPRNVTYVNSGFNYEITT